MKKVSFYSMCIALFCLVNMSCDNTETSSNAETVEFNYEAIKEFEKFFTGSMESISNTRSTVDNATDEDPYAEFVQEGEDVCNELIGPSETALKEMGFTDDVFEDVIKETYDEGICSDSIPMRELKCFTALAIYEIYENEKIADARGENYLDYITCISLGMTTKQISKMATRKIALLAAKKLASKLIPYIGWGWAVASTANCIAELQKQYVAELD